MKTKVICGAFFVVTIAIVAIACTQKKQQWAKDAQTAFDHIVAIGKPEKSGGQILLILPEDKGEVYAITTRHQQVIGIATDTLSFWFFLNEPKNFKGNLVDGKYMFRLTEDEAEQTIKKTEAFLAWFNKEKPERETPLFENKDAFSIRLANLTKKIQERGTELQPGTFKFRKLEKFYSSEITLYNLSFAVIFLIRNDKDHLIQFSCHNGEHWSSGLYEESNYGDGKKGYEGYGEGEKKITSDNMEKFLSMAEKIIE